MAKLEMLAYWHIYILQIKYFAPRKVLFVSKTDGVSGLLQPCATLAPPAGSASVEGVVSIRG